MKNGMEACIERGLAPGKDSYSLADFNAIGVPMVVACTGCGMTMAVLSQSVRVDEREFVWCRSCAGEDAWLEGDPADDEQSRRW